MITIKYAYGPWLSRVDIHWDYNAPGYIKEYTTMRYGDTIKKLLTNSVNVNELVKLKVFFNARERF
jgi:hypothetical protein